MYRTILLRLSCLLLGTALLQNSAWGQEDAKAVPEKQKSATYSRTKNPEKQAKEKKLHAFYFRSESEKNKGSQLEKEGRSSINVESNGGPFLVYIELVKKALGGKRSINIVINDLDLAHEIILPPISLTRVSVSTALNIIPELVDKELYNVRIKDLGGDTPVYVVSLQKMRRSYKRVAPPPKAKTDPALEQVVQCFVLSSNGKLDSKDPKVVALLGAIDTALSLQDPKNSNRLAVQFHPDSGALLAAGTMDQLSLVSDIVDKLIAPKAQLVAADIQFTEPTKTLTLTGPKTTKSGNELLARIRELREAYSTISKKLDKIEKLLQKQHE